MKKLIYPSILMITMAIIISSWTYVNGPNPLPTSMRITVIDYVGNVVEGAAVQLFLTEKDYRGETNQVGETQYTDKKGRATIKNLQPRVYYLYVTKDDMNNIGGGVRTDTLVEGKVNKLNVVIE
jgi:hypothetical protein